jgi:SH3 domain-containing protein
MQPSSAWKAEYAYPPLEEAETHPDAPAFTPDGSTASNPNIATLVERFNEPVGSASRRAPTIAKPPMPPQLSAVPMPPRPEQRPPQQPAPARRSIPSLKDLGVPVGSLVPALVGLAVVPLSFAFFLWWQDTTPAEDGPIQGLAVAAAPTTAAQAAEPAQSASAPAITLTAPTQIEADAGGSVAFPIAIDSADALPARSIVAISALPQGATFSQGRPYGDTGWSLAPDEIAGLHLQLPANGGSGDMRLELIAGDGAVLAQSTTQFSITPPQVAATDDAPVAAAPAETAQAEGTPNALAPAQETASAETTGSIAPAPTNPAASEPEEVKVNTVKTVAVEPPTEAVPHDGAYALGTAAEEEPTAPEEWMETKTAVDMHARAEQKSETVKVAQGGLKLRVTGRDKNWIQVNDPKSGTTGWIYNRFLKEAEAPAQ